MNKKTLRELKNWRKEDSAGEYFNNLEETHNRYITESKMKIQMDHTHQGMKHMGEQTSEEKLKEYMTTLAEINNHYKSWESQMKIQMVHPQQGVKHVADKECQTEQ